MNISSKTADSCPTDRYDRHRLIDGFDQDRLAAVDVIVIGAGAVGNEVLKNLALLGVGRIEIHDFDLIEVHNLTRSILFHEGLVGRPKAEAAAEACKRIDPNVSARGYIGDFRDRLDVERVRAADAVLCCVDNHESRIHLNRLCLLAGTPFLNAAIDAWEASTEIYPHCGADAAACYECWIPAAVYAVISQRYSCGGLRKASIEQRRIPTTTLTSSIAGASMVSLLLQHVCELTSKRRGAIQSRSRLLSLTAEERAIAKNPSCPACGTYAGAPALLPCAAAAPANTNAFTTPQNEEPIIILSEPIITGWSCQRCGSSDSLLARARDHDTSLTWCPECESSSRAVSIISESTPSHLAELAAGRPLPIRFLYCPSSNPPVVVTLPPNNAQ
jgi:molybdopterin/thiamine biosynthesis adenylyltransferase